MDELYNEGMNFRKIALKKEKEIDEQSCAFQNLINLNKNITYNKSLNTNINKVNNTSYNIQIKKSLYNKRIEKSPDCIKFYLTESKNYFHDDKFKTQNNKVNKNNNQNITNDISIDNKIPKNKNRNVINLNKINQNKNNFDHKSLNTNIIFNQKTKGKDLTEYDGDMETVSFRNEYYSASKNKYRKNSNILDKNNNNKNKSNIILSIDKNSKNGKNLIVSNLNIISDNKSLKRSIDIIEPIKIKLDDKNSDKIDYETFCLGFFVTGLSMPFENNKIIEDSVNYVTTCGHKYCSLLFSIKPDILYYYKKENFEISDDLLKSIINLSFPLGLKICVEGTFGSKNVTQNPQQIVYNIIENNKGEKYYLCTKYYYIKLKTEDFKKNYQYDISSFFSENISKNTDNTFKKNITSISKVIMENRFLIPKSITLLSKEPFFYPMKVILNGFVPSLFEDRINLINHVINEVPVPSKPMSQIKFFISSYSSPIILNNEFNIHKSMILSNKEKQKELIYNNQLSKEQLNYKKLFDIISIEHIIFIFQMILLEQKILFIYNNYETLSQIVLIFACLIYPFSLKNIHIYPFLSRDTFNSLKQSDVFISGIDENLLSYIDKNNNKENGFNLSENNVIIYNISQKYFISNKNRKKTTRKDLMHEYKLSPMPEKVISFLTKEIKNIIKIIKSNQDLFNYKVNSDNNNSDINFYNKYISFKQNLEYETKLAFMKSIIMLIGDYNNYTFYIEGEKPLFNRKAFIESHKDKDFRIFLNQFLNTKIFDDFLENQKQIFNAEKNNLNNNKEENKEFNEINNIDQINNPHYFDTSFFIKLIPSNLGLINNPLIKNNNNNIGIINKDIYLKAKSLCNKLSLINNNINNNVNNKETTKKKNQKEIIQKNKKKTKVLFSGKNYKEDNKNKKQEDNFKDSDNYLEDHKSLNTHILKESKISTEATTLNAYFNSIDKSDLKESNNENQKLIYIDIKSNRKLSYNEPNNDKHQIFKKYLLAPYFLNFQGDNEDYINENTTEEMIMNDIASYKKRKNIKDAIPHCDYLINIISKNLDSESYDIKRNKIYMINNNNYKNNSSIKDSINFTKEVKSFKNKYFKEEKSENDLINLNDLNENYDGIFLINKCFKSCFINTPEFNEQYLNLLKRLFANVENLEYFANLIIPKIFLNNINNYTNHKQLTSSSFNTFSKIMKLSFEKLNSNDYNLGRLLTLACFIYYKIEKDRIVYLYTDFLVDKNDNSQKNCQPFDIWNTEIFWIEFFNSEFENNIKQKEEDNEDEEIYERDKNNDNNSNINNNIKDELDSDWKKKMCLIKTVIGVTNIMNKLNLCKNFIINILEKMVLPVFVNDFYYINRIMNLALAANNVN